MTEYEAYDTVLHLLEVSANDYAGIFDIWIGVSFALIVTTYLAPKKMSWLTSIYSLTIYIAYSAFTMSQFLSFLGRESIARADALQIIAQHELEIEYVNYLVERESTLTQISFLIVFIGLLVGTAIFVMKTCIETHRDSKVTSDG